MIVAAAMGISRVSVVSNSVRLFRFRALSATVLVVDDEPKLRHHVRDYLQRDGYVVLEASTGQRALELARAARPALVVLDLGLPELPGEDVARLLRHDSAIAVIVLTAKADETSRVAGPQARCPTSGR